MKKINLFIISFIFLFIGIRSVNATDCQYSTPYNKSYVTVLIPNVESFDGNYRICFSSYQLKKKKCQGLSNSLGTIGVSGAAFAKGTAYVGHGSKSSYKLTSNEKCPNVIFYYTTQKVGAFTQEREYSGSIEFAPKDTEVNLIGFDTKYSTVEDSGISEFDGVFDFEEAEKDREKLLDEYGNPLVYGHYTVYLKHDKKNKKYLIVEKNGEPGNKCYVDSTKLVICKSTDGVGFGVAPDEIDLFWNGENPDPIFNKRDGYYLISSKKRDSDEYKGKIIFVDEDYSNSNYTDLSATLCDSSKNPNVLKVMLFFGYVLLIVKILIPLGLILIGTTSLIKTVMSGDADELKKNAKNFGIKIISAVIIFVLPTIINFAVSLVDDATDGTASYANCRICIFEPNECVIKN